MKLDPRHFRSITFIILLTFSFSCSTDKKASKDAPKKPATQSPASNQPDTAKTNPECRADLWQRVYDPSRLEVVATCKTVTGIVEEIGQNEDGDTHLLLKLDAGQDDLINKKNGKQKHGDLVVEIVCANPITDKKVRGTCDGYTNEVHLPKVGDAVKVTGSYVIDSHNGWAEIHPVSMIE